MLIGIDGSTRSTGHAFGGPQDAAPRGGEWNTPGCDEQGGVFDHTLGNLGRSIMELSRLIKPKAIYIEAPMSKIDREHSAASCMALIQLAGGMRMAAAMVHARVVLCATYNVRKTFGIDPYLSGEAAKAAVMAKLDEWGWTYAGHDEADAKLTWAHGMKQEYPGWEPNQPLLFDQVRASA